MATRVITGLVLAAVVILLIFFLPPLPLKLVIAGIGALAIHECARMILPPHPTTSMAFPVIAGTLYLAFLMLGQPHLPAFTIGTPVVLVATLVFYLFRRHVNEVVLSQVTATFFSILYAGLMLSFLGLIRDLPSGASWLLLVLASTFGADTGAYLVGRTIGKHKLAPHVSPGKTIEGLIGGTGLSVVAALITRLLIPGDLSVGDCVWVGLAVGFIGPLGDLSESMLKRSVGVKDSGNLIPGHGGLLDRIDALLFTAPFVYYYASYLRG
ncbi:MAG TPA: phosphatidate cytidylyltransferase [bacterium]|nr:phosphatidate cytidylyltransferase [bacterium]